MRAARVRAKTPPWGVICKKTYFTVCDLRGDDRRLDAMCVAFNSRIVTWFLALTSSRLGHNRPEVLAAEIREVPLPEGSVDLDALKSFQDVDACSAELYGLTEADMLLVEDCVHRTLPQAQHESALSGYHATRRSADPADNEPDLVAYADCILRVLRGTFGAGRKVGATVYEEAAGSTRLPVRMVAVHLGEPATGAVAVEAMASEGLMDALRSFHEGTLRQRARDSGAEGVAMQRVAFLFDRRRGEVGVRLHIVKPDQRRYWTRSVALHDADQLSGALLAGARQEEPRGDPMARRRGVTQSRGGLINLDHPRAKATGLRAFVEKHPSIDVRLGHQRLPAKASGGGTASAR